MRRPARLLTALVALSVSLVVATLTFANWTSSSSANNSAFFKIDCDYSHSAADDPIVLPGAPGASHLHDFFGNVSTNAYSTYKSMKGVTSTCVNGDRGAYWTPSLYRNGKVVEPERAIVYYSLTAYNEKIEAFPVDFRVILGNSKATTADQQTSRIYWGCRDNAQIDYNRKEPPANCATGEGIQLRAELPSCWDGEGLGTNAISHMAYPSRGECPEGFDHAFPRVGFHATYDFGTAETGKITFSSGSVYSIHLDFWNTWEQDVLESLVTNCSNQKDLSYCKHYTDKNTGAVGSPGLAAPEVSTPAPTTPTATSSSTPTSSATPSASTPASTTPTTDPTSPATAPAATTKPATSPSPTAPTTTAAPVAGLNFQQKSSGKCITAVRRGLSLGPCGTSKATRVVSTENGGLRLGKKCLRPLIGKSTGKSTRPRVALGACSSESARQWQLNDNGNIRHAASGKCLDSRKIADRKRVSLVLKTCSGSAGQIWNRVAQA